MEKKINVAELLKDCPKGMELDCVIYEDVFFVEIVPNIEYPIRIETKSGLVILLTKYGQNLKRNDAKCVIFPKGKTTWEEFVSPCQFKDGDIVATNDGHWIGITKGGKNGVLIPTYCITHDGIFEVYLNKKETWRFHRLATEEEKWKLFDAIKDNGYKWNAETKTLEKLIDRHKFKVGEIITNGRTISKIYSRDVDSYKLEDGSYVFFNEVHKWTLVPNKFDITTLVPFESKVLVRATDNQFWRPAIWGVKHWDWDFYCVIGGEMWEQCIPYKGNEHLLGNTDDCDDFYKTWRK